ncbi:MFS transporter [Candidatus Leptofilum sp.]|uniref:MFS transporter n=1 Tax=Candidatus Leptofilum sp. TaxID=3241576 RepID=UPI003B5A03AC
MNIPASAFGNLVTDRSRNFRYLMFGMLYFVQGIIVAFTGNFAKPYLNTFNIDADLIGLLFTLLLVPFIFKIFYGMLSDRVNLFGRGHRLPYIVVALIISMAGIFLAGFINPGENYTLFLILILATSFAVALFDTTADALAVDITPLEEQSRVQSIMTSGRAIGIIVMSLLIGWIATTLGYFWVFMIIALLMAIPLFWVLQVQEPPRDATKPSFEWRAFSALLQPQYLIFAAYGILSWIAYQGIEGLVTFYMSDELAAIETQIGTYGALKGVGTVVGALITSWLISRTSRRTTAMLVAGLVSLGGLVFSFAGSITAVLTLATFWGIVLGLHWTTYMVLAMTRTDARIAGSMFAISMAVSNIGSAIGDGVATGLTDNIGFINVFRLLAAINLIVFPLLIGVFRLAPKEETAVS